MPYLLPDVHEYAQALLTRQSTLNVLRYRMPVLYHGTRGQLQ